MSDLTDLFEGRFGSNPVQAVEAFAAKEWANLTHLVDQLPADLKPLAETAISDAKVVMTTAAEWAGTAVSAYVATNSQNLQTEVLNLLAGAMGGATPTSVAAQDTVQAVTALIQGIVQHAVMAFVAAQAGPVLAQPAPQA